MGKLVLFLADGSTMHVPLDKERLTLGRRADNDVCLPYPAVSGEHAVVVTILADSFLEDQGSTNGTLVNGKPTVKHFLRDHDQIEIGRQRLTYMSDDNARIEPLPPDIARSQLLGLTDRVEHQVRPVPKVVSGAAASSRAFPGGRSPALLDDLDQAFDASPVVTDGTSLGAGAVPARAAVASNNAQTSTTSRPRRAGSGMDVDATRVAPPEAPPVQRDHSASAPALAPQRLQPKREPAGNRTSPTVVATAVAAVRDPLPAASVEIRRPSVRVLSGPSLGRSVPFSKDEISVGRAGVQVAMVRRVGDGFLLVPVEGTHAPRINGAAVGPEGSPLHPGDTFEVAGVRLELTPG